jgi:hypothetical protein
MLSHKSPSVKEIILSAKGLIVKVFLKNFGALYNRRGRFGPVGHGEQPRRRLALTDHYVFARNKEKLDKQILPGPYYFLQGRLRIVIIQTDVSFRGSTA